MSNGVELTKKMASSEKFFGHGARIAQMDDESIETAIGKIQKQQWNRMKQAEEKNTRVNEMAGEVNRPFKRMEWDRRRAADFFFNNKHIRTVRMRYTILVDWQIFCVLQ